MPLHYIFCRESKASAMHIISSVSMAHRLNHTTQRPSEMTLININLKTCFVARSIGPGFSPISSSSCLSCSHVSCSNSVSSFTVSASLDTLRARFLGGMAIKGQACMHAFCRRGRRPDSGSRYTDSDVKLGIWE